MNTLPQTHLMAKFDVPNAEIFFTGTAVTESTFTENAVGNQRLKHTKSHSTEKCGVLL